MTTAEARTKLHDLVESLPIDDVPTALRVLEALNSTSDALPLALRDIPFDDEPERTGGRRGAARLGRPNFQGGGAGSATASYASGAGGERQSQPRD